MKGLIDGWMEIWMDEIMNNDQDIFQTKHPWMN